MGVFGHDAWRGESLDTLTREEPVRALRIVKMAAFHQHCLAAKRQKCAPLLFHLVLGTGMRRIQQCRRLRQIWRDQRDVWQKMFSQSFDSSRR
ncbi:hypothetical protein D3C87_1514440 [compost metagenome]